MHLMVDCRLAHGAFKQEDLVGKINGMTVQEIELELRRPHFLGNRVDVDVLRFTERVHVINERIEVVHRVDAVGLLRALGPAETSLRRLGFLGRIRMGTEQVKLDLRRHDWHPTAGFVLCQHVPQDCARRLRNGRAIAVITVKEDRRGRIGGPGHGP